MRGELESIIMPMLEKWDLVLVDDPVALSISPTTEDELWASTCHQSPFTLPRPNLRKSASICGLSRRRLGGGGFVCLRVHSRAFAVPIGVHSRLLFAKRQGSRNILIKSRLYFLGAIRLKRPFPPLMRYLLLRWLAALAWLGLCSLPLTSAALQPDQPDDPNFSGTWALDLKASTSFQALMKQIGAGFLERKYADSVKLKATLQQNEHVLTIAARGPGFAFDEILYLDGRTAPSKLDLLGATSRKTRTAWSDDRQQLIETHQINTKQGKVGQLIIKRYLIDEGKTLVATYTLKLNAEPNQTSARQIWHKEA
jgi:hypothetical protein